ncbi:MAG: winged helix-turn-helix domain-containing protein [Micrococcus sp.]|nr:winged helix-turn-helix domain-containing protein [Micrococcus sp.]
MTTGQGDVHLTTDPARPHGGRGIRHREAAPGRLPHRQPGGPPKAAEAEARGFAVYLGMDEAAAAAAGTSLRRLATELRHHVTSVVPGAEACAAVVIAPAGTPGTDLDVVRQVLVHPTVPAGATLVAADTGQPGVLIDLARGEARLDGEYLNLARKEFQILHYLVEHQDRAVGREELLEALWPNRHRMPGKRVIDVHIRRLRSKLGRFAGTVRTVHGAGYRFHDHPEITVCTTAQYGA